MYWLMFWTSLGLGLQSLCFLLIVDIDFFFNRELQLISLNLFVAQLIQEQLGKPTEAILYISILWEWRRKRGNLE